MADRIRVLHLIKELDLGGAERLVSLLVQVGDSSRFDYSVAFALSGLDGLAGPLREEGVPVHDLGAQSQADLSWMGRLRQLLEVESYDVVHLHLPYTAGLGRIVSWSLGAARPALVHTQHNIWVDTETPTRALSRVTWWMDDAGLAVSEAVRDALPAPLRRGTEVLVHGVERLAIPDPRTRRELRASLGAGEEDVVVLTVANLRREKGYDVLLPAALTLIEEDLPVRFVSVGHGPLEAEVAAEHRRLGLGERFVLTGLRRDVSDLLAAADVFVLASHTEGLPLSVMEALAAGLPVVVTRVGELPRIVREGVDGTIVPTGDPDALADALRRLVLDAGLRERMAAAVRQGSARFDIGAAARRVEEVYVEVVGRRRENRLARRWR